MEMALFKGRDARIGVPWRYAEASFVSTYQRSGHDG